jgi:hypothetical protein
VVSGVGDANPAVAPLNATLLVGAWRDQNKANVAGVFTPGSMTWKACGSGPVPCTNGGCSAPMIAGGGDKALFIRKVALSNSDRLEAVGITSLCKGFTAPMILRQDHNVALIKANEIAVARYSGGYIAIWADSRKQQGSQDLYFSRIHW